MIDSLYYSIILHLSKILVVFSGLISTIFLDILSYKKPILNSSIIFSSVVRDLLKIGFSYSILVKFLLLYLNRFIIYSISSVLKYLSSLLQLNAVLFSSTNFLSLLDFQSIIFASLNGPL